MTGTFKKNEDGIWIMNAEGMSRIYGIIDDLYRQ